MLGGTLPCARWFRTIAFVIPIPERTPVRPMLVVSLSLAAAGTLAAQPSRVRIGIIGHQGPVAIDSLATVVTIDAPRAQVFHAVAQVLAELKVPIDMRDSTRGIVGVMSVPKMRTFSVGRISRYLNCGSGITGLNADNWRVYVTALAFVDAASAQSTSLRLAMVGGAQDVAGAATDPVACGSTGVFEELVEERVKARLAEARPQAEQRGAGARTRMPERR